MADALTPVLEVLQDDAREDLVVRHGDVEMRVHYGPTPTWPTPKELEDEFLETVRTMFRQANGTEDPALWEGVTDARA